MSVTINAFPPLHTFTSPRSWALAFIVLLHVGFFVALTNGLSLSDIALPKPPTIVVDVPIDPAPPRPTPRPPVEPTNDSTTWMPKDDMPRLAPDEAPDAVRHVTNDLPPSPQHAEERPVPVIVDPEIDPRLGLSEPVYPSASIRAGHTGTVILSIQVLENGRVGDVRIETSSGYARLDEAAVREARRWRLIPGMRDGVPVVMWKQIPITFRLKK